MTEPQLPDIPRTSSGATVLTVGTDLVHVPGFSAQLDQPGTVFAQRTFTARELREARRRSQEGIAPGPAPGRAVGGQGVLHQGLEPGARSARKKSRDEYFSGYPGRGRRLA